MHCPASLPCLLQRACHYRPPGSGTARRRCVSPGLHVQPRGYRGHIPNIRWSSPARVLAPDLAGAGNAAQGSGRADRRRSRAESGRRRSSRLNSRVCRPSNEGGAPRPCWQTTGYAHRLLYTDERDTSKRHAADWPKTPPLAMITEKETLAPNGLPALLCCHLGPRTWKGAVPVMRRTIVLSSLVSSLVTVLVLLLAQRVLNPQ
jgi:hypothetical protein